MESVNDFLIDVKDFADKAHGTQRRKFTGERYIAHPVRVMELVLEFDPEVATLAAALLHDVLEDTAVTEDDLRAFLHKHVPVVEVDRIVSLVRELTDVYVKKDYPALNRRKRKELEVARLAAVSSRAQTIKYADIIDNVTDIAGHETDFAMVYIREAQKMMEKMTSGDPRLRARALHVIEQSMARVSHTANP